MRKFSLLVITILIFEATKAQVAVLKDPDGFTNVRKAAGTQSPVSDTLGNGRLVYCYEEEAGNSWIPIDYSKGAKSGSGYVHKSRMVFLESFPAFKGSLPNDSTLRLQYDSLQILIRTGSFLRKGRRIEYAKPQDSQQFISLIDGQGYYGTDGGMPKSEYRFIQVKWGDKTRFLPGSSFGNLFEPNLSLTSAYFSKAENCIYLIASNSDGAGAYIAVWTIRVGKAVNVDTFIPF